MSVWLRKLRKLPNEAQHIAAMVQLEDHIVQLKRERARLNRRGVEKDHARTEPHQLGRFNPQ